MGPFKILLTDRQRSELGKGRWGTQATALHILYFIVGNEMLGNTTNS